MRLIKVVLDTNVVVSAHLTTGGLEAFVLDLALASKLQLYVSPDPDGNRFLECAEAASADYLVTGNKRHFPSKHGKTLVVNARQLIEIITPELKR